LEGTAGASSQKKKMANTLKNRKNRMPIKKELGEKTEGEARRKKNLDEKKGA